MSSEQLMVEPKGPLIIWWAARRERAKCLTWRFVVLDCKHRLVIDSVIGKLVPRLGAPQAVCRSGVNARASASERPGLKSQSAACWLCDLR